jgi:hypothetical protein
MNHRERIRGTVVVSGTTEKPIRSIALEEVSNRVWNLSKTVGWLMKRFAEQPTRGIVEDG